MLQEQNLISNNHINLFNTYKIHHHNGEMDQAENNNNNNNNNNDRLTAFDPGQPG